MDPHVRWKRRLEDRRARAARVGFDYALCLAYDGPRFAGWARQTGQHTVEGCVRELLTEETVGLRRAVVAGRTDRGVSAAGQVMSFRSEVAVDLERLRHRLDAVEGLACLDARPAPRGFHAQFDASDRSYAYRIEATPSRLRLLPRLDALMRGLEGERDFRAYARQIPPDLSTVRRMVSARCRLRTVDARPVLSFELRASGFLRKMVRVVVATAIEAAEGGAAEDTLARLAERPEDRGTAFPAPPEPLCFLGPRYPSWPLIESPFREAW